MTIQRLYRTLMISAGLALPLVVALGDNALAQRSAVDSLTCRADSLFRAGKLVDARELYEAVLDFDEQARNARMGLGMTLLALDQWSSAKDRFLEILERDTADIAAQYYVAIAYRETGKTKAWLLRNLDWNKSRDRFLWVMRRDSAYEDVFYQYALLLQYRNDYPAAIAAGHMQLVKRPDLSVARLGLFRIYRSFVSSDRPAAIEWLTQEDTPIARYFLAEALRRDNRLDEAEQVLRTLLLSYALPQPIYLSLARIAAKKGLTASAEMNFWNAVDDISTPLGADVVFEDLKYIVTDEELVAYRALDTPQKKILFFRGFWNARNPAAAGQSNMRIAEHYQRLVYAEDHHEYIGFRTGFNNPDRYRELRLPASYGLNHEFNDMGLMYIRHGEPTSALRNSQLSDPNESWLYDATAQSPRRIFHFQKKNTVEDNWRLIPYPENADMLATLVTWDAKFLDLLRDNASAAEKAKDEIVSESRVTVSTALATDEHTWKKGITAFPFQFSIDAFRGTGTKSLVDVSYAIPLASLTAGSSTPGEPVKSEIGVSIRSRNGKVAVAKLDTIMIPPGRSENDTYANMYRYLVAPGAYTISMHVRPLEGNSFGTWKAEKIIPHPSEELSLSDIQYLLPSNVRTTLEIDGIKVLPSPFSSYATTRPLYVYLHVYNLVKDANGTTSYTVRYFLTPSTDSVPVASLDAENPDENSIVLAEKTNEGHEDNESVFGVLDIGNVKAGEYVLTVSVKDRKRVQTVIARRILGVFQP